MTDAIRWTQTMTNTLLELWPFHTAPEIAHELSINEGNIHAQIRRLRQAGAIIPAKSRGRPLGSHGRKTAVSPIRKRTLPPKSKPYTSDESYTSDEWHIKPPTLSQLMAGR